MANEFAQYKDEEPILRDVTPNDRSKGQEATAKSFGTMAELAFKKGNDLEEDASATQLVSATVQAHRYKTYIENHIESDPTNAKTYYEKGREGLDSIKNNAYVNSKDRAKLGYHIGELDDSLNQYSVKTQVNMTRKQAGFNFAQGFPDWLNSYFEIAGKNPEEAGKMREDMGKTLNGLYLMGAIDQRQVFSYLKAIHQQSESAHNFLKMADNGDATAKDLHKEINKNPVISRDSAINNVAPPEGNTDYLQTHYTNDLTRQGVEADAYNLRIPNVGAWGKLKDADQNKSLLIHDGAAEARSNINSGALNYYTAGEKYNELNSKKRNPIEDGEHYQYKLFFDSLKNGYSYQYYADSPEGRKNIRDWTESKAALNNDVMTNEYKQEQGAFIDNEAAFKSLSWMRARQIPANLSHPVGAQVIDPIEAGFRVDGDINGIFNSLNYHAPQIQGYIAQGLKDTKDQVVYNWLSLMHDNMKNKSNIDQVSFVLANQKGVTFPNINLGTDPSVVDAKTKKMQGLINVGLKPQFSLLKYQVDPEHFRDIQTASQQAILNYAKQQATLDGDLSMSNYNKYIQKGLELVNQGYDMRTGSNYIVNAKQLPLDNSQLNELAFYVTSKGYDKLRGYREEDKGSNRPEFGINPLLMTVSNTQDVMAVDSTGKSYKVYHYSPSLIHEAHDFFEKHSGIRHTKPISSGEAFEKVMEQAPNVE